MLTQDYLNKLGLNENQIKIYLDLASYPESTVVQVHNRISEPRSSIYLELERLINEGYVTSKKVGKSTLFKITDPKVFELNLKEETDKLNFLTQNLGEFDTEIKKLKSTKETQKSINVYKGSEGIKQLLWNILVSKEDLVVGFSPGTLESVTDRGFAEQWREEFRNRNKQNKIIFNKPKPLTWSEVPKFLKENVEAKSLDEKKIKFDRMTLIYGDVMAVCSLKEDKDQYGIEIKDRLLVNSQKQLFDFLWKHVAKDLKG
jgi:sugar-specific transcriptional regulator TrmB